MKKVILYNTSEGELMKNSLAFLAVCMLFLSACGGVSQAEYDSISNQVELLQSNIDEQKNSYENQLKDKNKAYESLEAEYSAYKDSMSEYEGLASAEAEARKIQAEELAESKAQAKAESIAESIAAKEAEEKNGYDSGITFDQLARNPDDYNGKKVKFRGKVLQVVEGGSETIIRLATKGGYDDVLYCTYKKNIVSSRILEDDKITIYGVSNGTTSYQSTMGGQITIPSITVEKIDQ